MRFSSGAVRMRLPGGGLTSEALTALLRARGRRSTRQRRAVYASLVRRADHPTADRLLHHVRRRVPGLSLATVYKTLEVLVRVGAAGRIADSDGIWRYDARTDLHDHRRCVRCGRMEDVDLPHRPDRIADIAGSGFRIAGYRLEIFGHCALCSGDRSPAANQPQARRGERE